MPKGIASIGDYAFYSCNNLRNITIPQEVTFIGKGAFKDCSDLAYVSIPEGVTSIRDYTFYNCKKLTTVTVPKSITSIGNEAFFRCYALSSITIPQGVISIGVIAFYECTSLTSITIPEGVTSIYEGAFRDCANLTSLSIPDKVAYIGKDAFNGCSNITSISMPQTVCFIDNQALNNCIKLQSVYIYNKDIGIGTASGSSIAPPLCGENNSFVTLYGYKGSTTEAHANKWGYKFEALPDDTNKPLQSISLNKINITLNLDQTSLLKVIYNPVDTTDSTSVKWSSSNSKIAIVYSNGKVKGVASGSAIITATVGDKTATCNVTVK